MSHPFPLIGNCRYGVDLAKQLTTYLLSVIVSCGSIRICYSNRTPEKVLPQAQRQITFSFK